MTAAKRTTPVRGSVLLLFCLSIGSAHPGLALPDANETWIQVRTAHFTIVSNASAKAATGAGVQLERFLAALEFLHPEERAHGGERSHLPTTILVFKDLRSFTPYRLSAAGTPESFIGKFTATPDGNYIGMSADPDGNPYRVIFHEFMHYFLSTRFEDFPLWENEGLAELYSTFTSEGSDIEVGRTIDAHLRFLETQSLIPLAELFALDTHSSTYNEGARQGVFYAESWALCHYLCVGMPHPNPTPEILLQQLEIHDLSTKEAIEAAFSTDYPKLEAQLRKYVGRGLSSHFRLRIPGWKVDETAQVAPVPPADLLYTLGDYLVHACPGRERDAEDHLREAIRADSSHARAHASLARLIEERRPGEAEAHYRKAIELAGDDALPYFLYGISKVDQFRNRRSIVPMQPDALPAELATVRELLGMSLQIDSSRAEAFAELGFTYLYDPEGVDEGISLLEQARASMPSRMDVVYNLMLLHLRKGDRDAAEQLAASILAHAKDPSLIQGVQEALKNDDGASQAAAESTEVDLYDQAVRKLNAGDLDGAIAGLERFLRAGTDSVLVGRALRARAEAEQALEQRRRVTAANRRRDDVDRQVDLYNQALAKAQAGESKQALAILERLVPAVKDPELARKARELLDLLNARNPPKQSRHP
jgi:tetratricopeptide (TPR) repeat protein